MSVRYNDVLDNLRAAYDGSAAERDRHEKTEWKRTERAAFLQRLLAEGTQRLLEIGAGTGQDAVFFKENGLDVVATDLSPAMVQRCRDKGVGAQATDVLDMDFAPASFDAVYTLNCLLHVPNADLPTALERIYAVLRPGGLCFVGVYGGPGDELVWAEDRHDPPRFFSRRTDEQIQRFARASFKIVDFHTLDVERNHFQSLTLRRP